MCFLMFPTEHCEQRRIIEAFHTRPNISYPSCYRNITNDPGQFYNTTILNRFNAEKERLFYLVQGPHGIGKTTTLSLYASMSKGNVLYFQIANPKHFGLDLAKAFGIRLCAKDVQQRVKAWFGLPAITCPDSDNDKLERCLKLIEDAVMEMKISGASRPLLILDNFNSLIFDKEGNYIKDSPLFLLGMFAKQMVDNGLLTLMFADSEGNISREFKKTFICLKIRYNGHDY